MFPLKASANGRYLVDQKGTPFRIHADSAWSLIANLTPAEVDTYLADRKSRGFNTLLVSLIERKFAVQAPRNRAGDYPFVAHNFGSYDFTTPYEPYFTHADSVIDKIAASGMVVMLDVMYTAKDDDGNEGWWKELTNATNTPAKCYAYGQILGKRWKNRANLVWIFGGDYTPPAGSEGETRLLQIHKGLRDAGATQLASAHIFSWLSSDWTAFAPFVQINGIYASGPDIYQAGTGAYARTPATPVFLFEPGYEAEEWHPGDPASIRSYEWWGQLSSIGGVFYGHRDVWEFSTDSWSSGYPFSGSQRWQLSLDTPGSRAMKYMADLLSTLPWYNLVPSGRGGMKTLVIGGGGSSGGNDYVTAAAASDGKGLIAYLPPSGAANRSITIDMTVMSASSAARWWDPANGTSSPIAGTIANTGPHAFTAPGNNSAAAHDWVLVVTAP